jgi:hypothetical protein
MKSFAFISLLWFTAAVSGVGAQELPKEPEKSVDRPLNLSVRKPVVPLTDAVVLPIDTQTKSHNQIQSGSTGSEAADVYLVMPYGAGYENRRQGESAESRSTGGGKGEGKSEGKSSGGEGKRSGRGEGGGSGGRGGSGRGS